MGWYILFVIVVGLCSWELHSHSYFAHVRQLIPFLLATTSWAFVFVGSVLWRYLVLPEESRSVAEVCFAVDPRKGAMAPCASFSSLCYAAVAFGFICAREDVFALRQSSPVFFFISMACLLFLSLTSFLFHFTSSLYDGLHRLDRVAAVFFVASLASVALHHFAGDVSTLLSTTSLVVAAGISLLYVAQAQYHLGGRKAFAFEFDRRAEVDAAAGVGVALWGAVAVSLLVVGSVWTPYSAPPQTCPYLLASQWASVLVLPVIAFVGVVFGSTRANLLAVGDETVTSVDHCLYDVSVSLVPALFSCGVAVVCILPQTVGACGSRPVVALSVACSLLAGGGLAISAVSACLRDEDVRLWTLIGSIGFLSVSAATSAWVAVL